MKVLTAWSSALVVAQLLGPAEDRTTKAGNDAYQEGELDEALKNYTRAQVEHPYAHELHYNIGNVQFRKDDLDKALEEYHAALYADAELKRRAHYNAGNIRYLREEWEDAVKAYSDALRIDPDDVEAQQNLELALQKLQEQPQQSSNEDESEQEQSPQLSPNEQGAEEQDAQQQPMEMTREEAEQILQALAQMEQAQQMEQQPKQGAKVRAKGKYW